MNITFIKNKLNNMNIIKLFVVINIAVCFIPAIKAQEFSVNAGVDPGGKTVIIRWYSSETFNIEGVNVYRRENTSGEWVRLNTAPIKRVGRIDSTSSDQNLGLYDALIYDQPKDQGDIGNWHLMQLTQGVTDPEFARAFGMEYDDNSAISGKSYEYKVTKIEKGKETEGTISLPVKIEKYKYSSAPDSLKILPGNGQALLSWKPEKKRYFCYNVYRSETAGGALTKINTIPVLVFMFSDKSGKFQTAGTLYTDTSLTNGKTYYYAVEGLDFLGRPSAKTDKAKVTPVNVNAPAPPVKLNGKIDGNKITITWKPVIDIKIKGLNIYRSISREGKYEKVNKKELRPTDTSFVEEIKNPEPAYFYYIEAVGTTGYNTNSNFIMVQVPDMNPPAKPELLKGIGGVGSISLSWNLGKDKNLLGYYIYRTISLTKDEFLLLTPYPVKTNIYIDTLEREHQNIYYYQIKAVSKNYILSVPSEIAKVQMKDVIPPSVPIIVNAWYEKGLAKIEWSTGKEEDLAGFNIYRSSLADGGKMIKLNKVAIAAAKNNYTDSIIAPAKYNYAIEAFDTNGNVSTMSLPVAITAEDADTVLGAPRNLTGIYSIENKTISLKWNKVIKANLSGYIVFKKDNGAPVAISSLVKETIFIDKEPLIGMNSYIVMAYDESGNVSASNNIQVNVP